MSKLTESLTPDQLESYHERAAIMEYDGGLARGEAEKRAMEIVEGEAMKGERVKR